MGALERRPVERIEPLVEDGVAASSSAALRSGLRLVCLLDRHRAIGTGPRPGRPRARPRAGQLRRLGPGLEPEQPVEGELEQVPEPAPLVVAGGGAAQLPQPLHHLPREQVGVALVNGLDLELGLVTRQVQVVLAAELLAESLRPLPVWSRSKLKGLQR